MSPQSRLPLAALSLIALTGVTPPRLGEFPRASEPAWVQRDAKIDAAAAKDRADVLLLGDSITQGWEFQDAIWTAHFPKTPAVNAGIASDRVEHILWRVEHGLFAAARPKVVVLLAGINNLALATPEQIADGDAAIIAAIHKHSPASKILVMAVFPSGHEPTHKRRPKIKAVNELLAKLADGDRVRFLDIGAQLLDKDGTLAKTTAFDYLHLTRTGYGIWAAALAPVLADMLSASPR